MLSTVVGGAVTATTTPLGAAVAGGFAAGLAVFAGAGAGGGAPRYSPEFGSTMREDSSTASKAEAGTRLRS